MKLAKLKERFRPSQQPAGTQHPRHVRQQHRRAPHVLEHLLAVDEIEAVIGERDRDAIESGKARVRTPARSGLAGA